MNWLFPALFDSPSGIGLSDLDEDEIIELVLRQHPIVNVGWIVTALLLLLVPSLVIFLNLRFLISSGLSLPADISLALVVLWYLFILAFVIDQFLHWYFNLYIVTNKHIIDLDFENLLKHDRKEARLDDIQSVSSQVAGIIAPLFNYGTVTIATAADKTELKFMNVPRPDFVEERIQSLQESQIGNQGGRDVG